MRLVVLLVLLALTVAGACAMSFQCDDAYITFRYVGNAMDGHGLVWNPPPFLPVEGYTGFLWALLLWGVWAILGVEPPDAVNVLSITFGIGQFLVLAKVALRLPGRDGARVPDAIALCALACIVGNRTFLSWMTSGLETALFNLAFLSWALLAFRAQDRRDTRWLVLWSSAAAVAALTRPDGLLLVAATGVMALPSLAPAWRRWRPLLLGLLPLATVGAHVLWRRSFYGEWLPNTYFAKIVAPWPEMGVLYLKCFLFEHGLWLWFPLALAWAVFDTWRHRQGFVATSLRRLPAFTVLGAIAFHTGYYVLKVGGDHFEYRVMSHLVPLAWLSFAAMATQLFARRVVVFAATFVMFLCSTLGWMHLAASGGMTINGINPVRQNMPAFLQPLWRWHDSAQMLLHVHFVCLRCNQHELALSQFVAKYPPRPPQPTVHDDVPVLIEGVVGVAGWTLRDCSIVDRLGLNDWVVARTPLPQEKIVPLMQHLQDVMATADVDRDGRWEREELGRWFASFFSTRIELSDTDPLVDMALDLFADRHGDALDAAESREFVRQLCARGAMAHERVAPPGYTEAFEENVAFSPAGVVVLPRAAPLRTRIPAIEAEWRERVRSGRFGAK